MKAIMKKQYTFLAIITLSFVLMSCFEDTKIVFEDALVEFEDAVMRNRATGQIFPIMPTVTRTAGTPNYSVNLVAPQLTSSEQITVSLEVVPAALLNATTIEAVEGVHFTLNQSFSFPEAVSKANFTGISILPGFPADAGKTALLVIKLDGNDKLKPSENYRRLGIRINLN
jgi:hypothetical protein